MRRREHRVLRDGHERVDLDVIADAFPDVSIAIFPYGLPGKSVMVVTLSGPRVADAAALLEQRVDCVTRDERLDAADHATTEELEVALLRLVSAAPDAPDDDVIARVARALQADRAEHRLAALRAMVIRPWPVFVPLAEHAAANDPDEDARLQAKITLLQLRDPPPPWS